MRRILTTTQARAAKAKALSDALADLADAEARVARAEAEYAETSGEVPADGVSAKTRSSLRAAKTPPAPESKELRDFIARDDPTTRRVALAALFYLGPLTVRGMLDAIHAHGFRKLTTRTAMSGLRSELWRMRNDNPALIETTADKRYRLKSEARPAIEEALKVA